MTGPLDRVAAVLAGDAVSFGPSPALVRCDKCGDRRHPSDLIDGLCPDCERDMMDVAGLDADDNVGGDPNDDAEDQ